MSEDSLRFEGRVALITGAGRGLGRAYARLLAARGAALVVNDVDAPSAHALADELEAAGGQAVADASSVAEPESAAALADAALERFGRVDVLVHNAGVLRSRPFEDLEPEDVRSVLDVHLAGAFWVGGPVWRAMRAQEYGRIVLISSNFGLFGATRAANYCAAKLGLVGLTHALALEGRRAGIRVNAVAPLARTGMMEEGLQLSRQAGTPQGVEARLVDRLDPERVAPLVAYLAHESCETTGEIFSAGAGHFSRVMVAEGPGWTDPDATPERIAAHLEEIRSASVTVELAHARAEFELIERALEGHKGG